MLKSSLRLSLLIVAFELATAHAMTAGQAATRGEPEPKVQTAKVVVTELGFEPDKITLRAGTPARITFVRTTEQTCGTEVLFPSLKIERPLPLNEPVTIEFTPTKAGDIAFACGMAMLRGTVVVVQR